MAAKLMKAVKVLSAGKAEIRDVPLPTRRDGTVLVKVKCVAINPIDWMNRDMLSIPDSTLGCDFSGTIEAIGPKVIKSWNVGDRVSGWVVGNNIVQKEDGSFAEYCLANAQLCIKVPDGATDIEAASPPVAIGTAGQAMFQKLGMVLPGQGNNANEEPVLIYGGTSATATLAIQLAKQAGYEVITTCSPRSFDHVKSLGAAAAFDYKDPDCAAKIREYTKDNLTKVFDTISKDDSPKICAGAISSTKGGTICCLLPYHEDTGRKDVEVKMLLVLGIFGEDFGYGETIIPGNPEDFEIGKRIYDLAEKLWHEGKLVVHPPKTSDEGLEGIFAGLEEVKSGRAGGVKLIYKLE